MTSIGEMIATTADDLERTKRGIDSYTGSIYIFNIFTDTYTIDDTYLKISNRQIGSTFVVGHPTNGRLGAVSAPQPKLGENNLGAWVAIVEYTGATAP